MAASLRRVPSTKDVVGHRPHQCDRAYTVAKIFDRTLGPLLAEGKSKFFDLSGQDWPPITSKNDTDCRCRRMRDRRTRQIAATSSGITTIAAANTSNSISIWLTPFVEIQR
jgi:hypothetical protein